MLEPGDGAKGLGFAVSPARRGFVWRDLGVALLPDTQVFRKRPPRATAAPGRALQSFSDLRTGDYVVHEDHGVAQLQGLRDEGGRGRHPRLSAARLPRRRPRLRPARADRQGQPLHRLRLEGACALEARRQGVGQPEDSCARSTCARWPASCCSCTRSGRRNPASRTTSSTSGSSASSRSSRTARRRTSGRRSRR